MKTKSVRGRLAQLETELAGRVSVHVKIIDKETEKVLKQTQGRGMAGRVIELVARF